MVKNELNTDINNEVNNEIDTNNTINKEKADTSKKITSILSNGSGIPENTINEAIESKFEQKVIGYLIHKKLLRSETLVKYIDIQKQFQMPMLQILVESGEIPKQGLTAISKELNINIDINSYSDPEVIKIKEV